MNQAIEIVVFRARDGVKPDQLQTAAAAITPILAAMPGFISRDFGASSDGRFVDVVRWEDHYCAKQAAELVMSIPLCGAFFRLIEQREIQAMHFMKLG